MSVYKILYLNAGGERGRLPDLGIINAGGTSGPTFYVGGKPLLFADGTATDGTNTNIASLTLQGVYDNSVIAAIDLDPGKHFTLNAVNSKYFSVNADTGKVTITGDLEVLGSSTVVEGTLANVDQIVINPPGPSVTGLIIEPQPAVVMTSDVVSIKVSNGGSDVFRIAANGDVFISGLNFNDVIAHLQPTGIKHAADQISVAGPFLNVSGTNVEQALASIDSQLGGLAAAISTYEHVQATPAGVWTIVHAQGSTRPVVAIYDNTNEQVLPDAIEVLDGNTIEVRFNTPIDGRAMVILF